MSLLNVLDVLAALPLVVLFVLGRSSRHRQLLLIAGGAVVVEVAFYVLNHWTYRLSGNARLVSDVLGEMVAILTLASWALLLYSALQGGRGRWLLAIAAVLAITFGPPLLLPVQLWGNFTPVIVPFSPLAALLFAWLLPTTPTVARAAA